MRRAQGFTLIELIVVIVILGILAATALPRFTDIEADARLAKINGALGAVKSAAAIAHAGALVQGQTGATGTITMEGASVALDNGYPDEAGIVVAAGGLGDYNVSTSGTTVSISTDANHTSCVITYTPPAVAGNAPAISAAPARTDCD